MEPRALPQHESDVKLDTAGPSSPVCDNVGAAQHSFVFVAQETDSDSLGDEPTPETVFSDEEPDDVFRRQVNDKVEVQLQAPGRDEQK